MFLPNLSKLTLNIEQKRKQSDSPSSYDADGIGDDENDIPPYRQLHPPSRSPKVASEIIVRRVVILPRPSGASPAHAILRTALESFGEFLLASYEPMVEERFEKRLNQWVNSVLTLPMGPLDYNTAVTFLGNYMALSIMAINATGPPLAPWGGPITNPEWYPVTKTLEIWAALKANGRYQAVRNVLNTMCTGSPQHPWYDVDKFLRRMGTYPFIDTLGGIVSMTSETEPNHKRELLIATRGSEFMGHIFVSYANEGLGAQPSIKGLMPYGIQRSAFYLPGTCQPPEQTSGFVESLFKVIREIANDNAITHIFTWPLKKMKERFVRMGYALVPKQTNRGPEFEQLKAAIHSIYGVDSSVSEFILGGELQRFDFVMLKLSEDSED